MRKSGCSPMSAGHPRGVAVCLLLLAASPRTSMAQIQVVDSLGMPVPYAILESSSGQRVVADGSGLARAARPTSGPWLARRIGYRPARSGEGAERIVLARLPAVLATYRVEEPGACSATTVAARAPTAVVNSVRTLFAEYDERRVLASREREGVAFAVDVILEGEGGQRLEGAPSTITMPLASAPRAYVAGRAIERVDGEWVLRRPSLQDLASDAFLETHCLSIADAGSDSLTVVRFVPREDLAGPQLRGRYVVDRRTGRLHSDTLDYERPPKGAPGQARLVGHYADGSEGEALLAIPVRLVETVTPADMRVSLDGKRVRIVRTERTLTRLPR